MSREIQTKPIPPEPDVLVAGIDASLARQVLCIAKRKRKQNVQRDRKADDLVIYRMWLPGYWKPLPARKDVAGSGDGWIEMIWVRWTVPEYDQPPSSPWA